jgi:DNA-binding protein YbaB
MSAEFRASLESVRAEYSRRVEDLERMRRDLQEISAKARTRDGMVSVALDPHGRVQEIRFDPRVYQRMSPMELSRTILRLIGEASADIATQLQEVMAPFVPAGFSFEDALGEQAEVDFAKFLPSVPSMLAKEAGPVPGHDR